MARKPKPSAELKTPDDAMARLESCLSPIQLSVLRDPARFILIRAGRRSGKTYYDAVEMLHTALKYPGDTSLYLGLTKESAKEAIWDLLLKLLNDHTIAHKYSEAKLEIELLNGSRLRITGADADKLSDRLRGRKHRLVIVDECAFYTAVDKLILSALLPTLSDYQGRIIMSSSPGLIPKGLFYEADQGAQVGNWSRYHWTAADNPHFMRPSTKPEYSTLWEEELDTICKLQFNGDREHSTFRREYLGIWTFDKRTLCYPFDIEKYLIAEEYDIRAGEYGLGVNLSVPGRQSAVVVKCGDYNREVQVVKAFPFKSKNLDDLADTIEQLIDEYDLNRVVVYIGDHPKSILDDFKSRYKLPVVASRHEKIEYYQKLIATDLEKGHVRAVDDDTAPLIEEWSKVVKDDAGNEIADQDTLLSDAFFVIYLDVYSTTLKQAEVPESDEDAMERQLVETALDEIEATKDMYGYDDSGNYEDY